MKVSMAYVHPRERTTHDIVATAARQGTRLVAILTYAAAVVVAIALLAPVLPVGGSKAEAVVPSSPQPVLYTPKPGDTARSIAASQGISLAELFALNPDLTPLGAAGAEPVVVGLR